MMPTMRRALLIILVFTAYWIVLPSVFIVLGWRLDRVLGFAPLGGTLRIAGCTVCFTLGAVIVLLSVHALWRRGGGIPLSWIRPPDRLVDSGPFRLWRHPIYVGLTLIVGGIGFAAGSIGVVLFSTTLFVLLWLIWAIVYEEPALRRRFGAAYAEYERGVARVFPKGIGKSGSATRTLNDQG